MKFSICVNETTFGTVSDYAKAWELYRKMAEVCKEFEDGGPYLCLCDCQTGEVIQDNMED